MRSWVATTYFRGKTTIIGLGLILLVSLLFFFSRNGSFRENGVELKIDGPSEIASGDLITYRLSYKNNNKQRCVIPGFFDRRQKAVGIRKEGN